MRNNIVSFTRLLAMNKKRVLSFGLAVFAGVVVSLLFHSGYAFAVVMTACFTYFCFIWWKAVKEILKLYKK
jgi:hypothetical protein